MLIFKRVGWRGRGGQLPTLGSANCLFVCVDVLRPSQQLRSYRADQLPINTVPGQA